MCGSLRPDWLEAQIIARIEETSQFNYMKVRGDEPPYMAFRVEREFTLSKKPDAWIIEDVQLLERDGLTPINEVVTTVADSIDQSAVSPMPASDISKDNSPSMFPDSLRKATENITSDISIFYTKSAMASYATTWATSRNPSYRQFSNDCTNFISQAMSAGGWTMVPGFYQNNNVWWYNLLNQSYTWAGAENWYWFARGSGRTLHLSNVWQMELADVLQMDFDRNSNINHTMIVTSVTPSERYLSYHTNDTLNRSLSSIIAAYPSAWYYAHRT